MRNKVALIISAAALLCTATAGEAAVKETDIYSFTGGNDGSMPEAGLIAGPNHNLFGTTTSGGAYHNGVVFELAPPKGGATAWTQTTLYSFTGGADGGSPHAALLMDDKHNLYGTAYSGGADGQGVVFKLHKAKGQWKYSVLWTFTGGNDGGVPSGSLSMDSAGNLYGTTMQGGTGVVGTVFELSPPTSGKQWTETVLYNFTGNNDGGQPMGNVLLGADGNIYGTTDGYGEYNYGIVYRLTPPQSGSEWNLSVLHAFQGGSDGEVPRDGLIQGPDGTLYGTTAGFSNSRGNVFKLNPDGSGYEVIYTIAGGQGFTGNGPWSTVSMGDDGKLYGTTFAAGESALGEVFQLRPREGKSWVAKVLYTFPGQTGGQYSYSKVLIDKLGRLYGTTHGVAGQQGFYPGTVWRIKP
ncbi:MAG TPA: choice-of-anchor tandem repeat GloVer-containing protein [Rhizomicrobium sp.]|nr:choice-of-anchor tandem repeat GloVer-containing protein [Rhizomicrobium sp.]